MNEIFKEMLFFQGKIQGYIKNCRSLISPLGQFQDSINVEKRNTRRKS